LALSEVVLMQPLPQCMSPLVQVQVPAVQIIPLPQTCPHAPQLFGSLWSGMHAPLQYAWPAGQVHAPAMQVDPPPQTVLHEPQFALSLVKSTHDPLGHLVGVPLMHVVLHVPPLQLQAVAPAGTGIELQLFPHAPQLARSDCKLTH
jgi:hypothetical protein